MSNYRSLVGRCAGSMAVCAAFLLHGVAATCAQSTDAAGDAPTGRIDFDAANLPAANVEVDLSQEVIKDLFGIGDAAVAGIAETLFNAADVNDEAQTTRLAAEQLEAARQILQLAGNVVREVRVRVYEDSPDEAQQLGELFAPFDEQLRAGQWETLARVRNEDETARVSVLRRSGAVRGIFVTAADGGDVVLANIVCDISPENVKKLTSAATKIGLENGLAQAIEIELKHFPRKLPTPPARPAAPDNAEPPRQ